MKGLSRGLSVDLESLHLRHTNSFRLESQSLGVSDSDGGPWDPRRAVGRVLLDRRR